MDVNDKISIVIPCYNEADGIDAAIERILAVHSSASIQVRIYLY